MSCGVTEEDVRSSTQSGEQQLVSLISHDDDDGDDDDGDNDNDSLWTINHLC